MGLRFRGDDELEGPVFRDGREIGLESQSGLLRQHDLTIPHVGDTAAKLLAQRIVVAIDLEPAAAAGGKQMRGSEKPDAAAEKMRAIGALGSDHLTRDRKAAGDPAPLGRIRLKDGQDALGERGRKDVAACEVFTAGKRHRYPLAQAAPLAPGPVGAQRLFQPHQAELIEPGSFIERLTERETLIDVDRKLEVTDHAAEIAQIIAIAFGAETDLQLEGAMAAAHRGFRHPPERSRPD